MKILRLLRIRIIILILTTALLAITGCAKGSKNVIKTPLSPESFLKSYNIKVINSPEKFKIEVPESWDIKAGQYPIGLYWELANVFSKDAGLDLAPLKGHTVEVWRYSLSDGLPGQGDQSKFSYPSYAILLVENQKVKGAYLCFNRTEIGPSVKKHYIKDITGLAFEEWVQKENLFSDMGSNGDLSSLEPVDLLKAYFKAIDDGNKVRAYSCLSPVQMLSSLTMNPDKKQLYNSGFSSNNSMVENIISASPLSFKLMDPDTLKEIQEMGNRTRIKVAVTADIKWRDNASPGGREIRFAILTKYKNGWKLEGLGTGP